MRKFSLLLIENLFGTITIIVCSLQYILAWPTIVWASGNMTNPRQVLPYLEWVTCLMMIISDVMYYEYLKYNFSASDGVL